jgi:hypothetical protein
MGANAKNHQEVAIEGSNHSRSHDGGHGRRCRAGARGDGQVVKTKLYRLALAGAMLALTVEALGAPRKW